MNAIERKNILIRLSQNRNRFNPKRAIRERIMYELLPYSSDEDFEKALGRKLVGDENFALQTRFDYFIGLFESTYGDLVFFWELMDTTDARKVKGH